MSLGIQASVNKFAFLHVQDSSEEDDSNVKPLTRPLPKKSDTNVTNAKKKTRRRKKKHTNSTSDSTQEGSGNQMKDWVQHDNHLVEELYDVDLKRALELSKVEFEKLNTGNSEQAAVNGRDAHLSDTVVVVDDPSKKEKKKKNKVSKAISLEEFHQRIEQTLPLHEVDEPAKVGSPTKKSPSEKQSNFFEEVENEARYIKRNEHIFQHFQAVHDEKATVSNAPRTTEICNKRDQRVHASQEKDKQIEKLTHEVEGWEKKFKHVKKRNQQLLLMLQQGEMKGKSELLLEVERLSILRDELTSDVAMLNEHLEQERSRSRKLKDELLKVKKSHEDASGSSK